MKLDEKFQSFKEKLKDSILLEIQNVNQKVENKIQEATQKTYTNITRDKEDQLGTPQIKEIIKEARNEELEEEREQKLRSKNVIIHGVSESKENDDKKAEDHDQNFVKMLFKDANTTICFKYCKRIGQKNDQNKRPIKVILQSENEKATLINSLSNLKGKDTYKGVSVTEDFTRNQRDIIKIWNDKAKQKTREEQDETTVWRVRGDPKNGLYLKKFKIKEN